MKSLCYRADKWTLEWPTEPGKYWAWGERFKNAGKPAIFLVEVWKCANGPGHVTSGHFLYKSECGPLIWTPAYIPTAPTAEQVEAAYKEQPNADEIKTV